MHVESAQIEWVAKNPLALANTAHEESVFKLLEALDEMDDVQNVYANLA